MDSSAFFPFHRSYRVSDRFIAGAYPGSADFLEADLKLWALVSCGVTRVISLMEASETDHHGRAFTGYEHENKKGPDIPALGRVERLPCRTGGRVGEFLYA